MTAQYKLDDGWANLRIGVLVQLRCGEVVELAGSSTGLCLCQAVNCLHPHKLRSLYFLPSPIKEESKQQVDNNQKPVHVHLVHLKQRDVHCPFNNHILIQ